MQTAGLTAKSQPGLSNRQLRSLLEAGNLSWSAAMQAAVLTAICQPGLSIRQPNRPLGNSPGNRARRKVRRATQVLLVSMSEDVRAELQTHAPVHAKDCVVALIGVDLCLFLWPCRDLQAGTTAAVGQQHLLATCMQWQAISAALCGTAGARLAADVL